MFCFEKDLIFKLNRKVEKGDRNDEMARRSNSKALLSIHIRMSFALIIHGSSIFSYSKRASRFGRDPFCRYTAENTLMPSFSLTAEQTEHQAR